MPRNVNRRYVQDTEFAVWSVKKNEKWTFNKPKEILLENRKFIGIELSKEYFDIAKARIENIKKDTIF